MNTIEDFTKIALNAHLKLAEDISNMERAYAIESAFLIVDHIMEMIGLCVFYEDQIVSKPQLGSKDRASIINNILKDTFEEKLGSLFKRLGGDYKGRILSKHEIRNEIQHRFFTIHSRLEKPACIAYAELTHEILNKLGWSQSIGVMTTFDKILEEEKIINKTVKPKDWGHKYLFELRFLKKQHEGDKKIPYLFEVLEDPILISIWEVEESKGKIKYYIDFLKEQLTDDVEFTKYRYEYPENYEELAPNQQDIIFNQQSYLFEHRHGGEEGIDKSGYYYVKEIYPNISIPFNFNIFENLPEAIAELTFFQLR